MEQGDLRSLTLVLAGALIGFIVVFVPTQQFSLLPIGSIALLAFVFLLYGTGILQKYHHRLHVYLREREPFKVGILSELGTDFSNLQIWTWADVPPDVWKSRLEYYARQSNIEIRVHMIDTSDRLERFAAILNPYGGVYSEHNLRTLETLTKFLDYVEGGIFVNVADVPTYWAYRPTLHRRVDATPTVYVSTPAYGAIRVSSLRPFELTPLMKELALRGLNMDNGLQVNLGTLTGGAHVTTITRRVVLIDPNVESHVVMPPIPAQDANGRNTTFDASPLFTVRYGKGEFLISLIWINDAAHSQQAKDIVRDTIAMLTISRIQQHFSGRKPHLGE